MGLFEEEDAYTKVTNRISDVEKLSAKLNGNFINDIEKIKSKFSIDGSERDLDNCNAITGEIQGFEYCFIEYFHRRQGKNDHSHWITKVFLRFNKDIPDFELNTKNSANKNVWGGFVFGSIFLLIPTGMIVLGIVAIINRNFAQLFNIIPFGLFGLIFGLFGGWIIHSSKRTYNQINDQGKYNIHNPRFREKYVIFSDDNLNKIRQTFNENVVSKIVDAKPEISSISVRNNCLSSDFDRNDQLSYASCNKYLAPLLQQAKILEEIE